jgi:hypothetical protein
VDNSKKIDGLAWVIGLAVGGVGAFYLLPILASMAIDFVTILLCGFGAVGLYFAFPAFCEAVAQLSYRLWETAIRADPIARAERDLRADQKSVKEVEENLGKLRGAKQMAVQQLNADMSLLDPSDIEEAKANIAFIDQCINEISIERDRMITGCQEFARVIERSRAKLRVSNSIGAVAKSMVFNKNAGKDSAGARIALEEVSKRMAENRGKLETVLSRQQTQRALAAPTAGNRLDTLAVLGSRQPVLIEQPKGVS